MSVYFIRNRLTGNVKIGVTARSAKRRLRAMQTGCDGELEILLETQGDETLEAELHTRFASDRIRGEWFSFSPSIRVEIERRRGLGRCLMAYFVDATQQAYRWGRPFFYTCDRTATSFYDTFTLCGPCRSRVEARVQSVCDRWPAPRREEESA